MANAPKFRGMSTTMLWARIWPSGRRNRCSTDRCTLLSEGCANKWVDGMPAVNNYNNIDPLSAAFCSPRRITDLVDLLSLKDTVWLYRKHLSHSSFPPSSEFIILSTRIILSKWTGSGVVALFLNLSTNYLPPERSRLSRDHACR
jgi:hypothetical protein